MIRTGQKSAALPHGMQVLERAYSRLDYFTATPERHARNGLKVTLAEFTIAELEKSRVARRAGGWLLLAS